MRINCFGEETEDLAYDKNLPRQPLETKDTGGATFMRFGDGDLVPIHRLAIDAEGVVRRTWAHGRWADAESLDYRPITETKEVSA